MKSKILIEFGKKIWLIITFALYVNNVDIYIWNNKLHFLYQISKFDIAENTI